MERHLRREQACVVVRAGRRLACRTSTGLLASLFDNRVHDLIEQVPRDDGVLIYRNVGAAHSRGIEFEGSTGCSRLEASAPA